jgi:hypothetical protein
LTPEELQLNSLVKSVWEKIKIYTDSVIASQNDPDKLEDEKRVQAEANRLKELMPLVKGYEAEAFTNRQTRTLANFGLQIKQQFENRDQE